MRKKIGEELLDQLSQGYDIKRISNWANKLYFEQQDSIDLLISKTLECLFRMEDDKQFEYPPKELQAIALLLINTNEDAIEVINCLVKENSSSCSEYASALDNLIKNTIEKGVKEKQKYLETPDSSIEGHATELDKEWLFCPNCLDAWESNSRDAMVICPKCNHAFHNPRYNPKDLS